MPFEVAPQVESSPVIVTDTLEAVPPEPPEPPVWLDEELPFDEKDAPTAMPPAPPPPPTDWAKMPFEPTPMVMTE